MLKRFGLWLLAAFFTFCLLSVAYLSATNAVFGTPEALKKSLADSDVYEGLAAGLVDQLVKTSQKPPEAQKPGDDVQLDEQVVRDVATKVVTADKLQVYAEQVIDGSYDWLEGDTEKPTFNLDAATIKKDFGNSVGDVALERMEGLPACTVAQLRKINPNDINPFTLPCRPPGYNLKAERAKLVKEIVKGDEVLEDTKINADDLKDEQTGEEPFENLTIIPTMFQLSKIWPWVLGVLGIGAAAGVIYWNDEKRKGIKKVAIILLTTGILIFVLTWISSFLLGHINFDKNAMESAQMQQALVDVVKTLSAAFNRVLMIFAVVYVVLGVGGLIWLKTSAQPAAIPAKTKKR